MRFRKDGRYPHSWLVYDGGQLAGRVTREQYGWVARRPHWQRVSKIGRLVEGKLLLFATRKAAAEWLISSPEG